MGLVHIGHDQVYRQLFPQAAWPMGRLAQGLAAGGLRRPGIPPALMPLDEIKTGIARQWAMGGHAATLKMGLDAYQKFINLTSDAKNTHENL